MASKLAGKYSILMRIPGIQEYTPISIEESNRAFVLIHVFPSMWCLP
jgi:hypothetical protein